MKGMAVARLTEANYLSRRSKLRKQIADARDLWQEAAFRAEIGEGEAGTVEQFAKDLADLEARLAALDAAWQRELSAQQADRVTALEAGRTEAATRLVTLLDERASAATAIDLAATALGEAIRKLTAAETAIRDGVASSLHLADADARASASASLHLAMSFLTHGWADTHVIAALMNAGADYSGSNWSTSTWEVNNRRSTSRGSCDASNRTVVAQVGRILPEVMTLYRASQE